jgi:hypothetical protein
MTPNADLFNGNQRNEHYFCQMDFKNEKYQFCLELLNIYLNNKDEYIVVILNWNGVQLLEQFFTSIIAFSPEATIYIADNASTDESIALCNSTTLPLKS